VELSQGLVIVSRLASFGGRSREIDQQSRYDNFINVQTAGFNATDVTWQLWGQRNPGGPDVLLQSGRIGKLGSSPVQIASTVPSSSSFPAECRSIRAGQGVYVPVFLPTPATPACNDACALDAISRRR
jgi:hypothetical protein